MSKEKHLKSSFVEGQPVKFVSLGLMESMKFTRLVMLFDKAIPPRIGRRKQMKSQGPQNRYIVEHLFGWYPSNQPLLGPSDSEVRKVLSPISEFLPPRKYAFAYEDELSKLTEEEYKQTRHEQKQKLSKLSKIS